MSTFDSMLKAIEGAGYHPKESGGIQAELKAYASGLDPIEAAADALLESLFIETADDAGLYRFESIISPEKPNTTLEVRREMLLHRGSITPDDLSPAVLQEHLPAAGVRGTLSEQLPNGAVTVTATQLLGVTKEQALFLLDFYLPAHLEIELDTAAVTG